MNEEIRIVSQNIFFLQLLTLRDFLFTMWELSRELNLKLSMVESFQENEERAFCFHFHWKFYSLCFEFVNSLL